jgi:alpha-L-fucosidase
MTVNSEGIYATRPWKIYGAGPRTMPTPERPGRMGFNERNRKDLTPSDVRFTSKGKTLYAFVMGWPGKEAVIDVLSAQSEHQPGKIHNVELLGHKGKLSGSQQASGLRVQLPEQRPPDFAVTFKIALV